MTLLRLISGGLLCASIGFTAGGMLWQRNVAAWEDTANRWKVVAERWETVSGKHEANATECLNSLRRAVQRLERPGDRP